MAFSKKVKTALEILQVFVNEGTTVFYKVRKPKNQECYRYMLFVISDGRIEEVTKRFANAGGYKIASSGEVLVNDQYYGDAGRGIVAVVANRLGITLNAREIKQ